MSRPRPQTRSPKSTRPRKGEERSVGWRTALTGRPTLPAPGRLAVSGVLVAVTVAALVMLVSVSAGGLNRFGLQRLAANAPASATAKVGYINR